MSNKPHDEFSSEVMGESVHAYSYGADSFFSPAISPMEGRHSTAPQCLWAQRSHHSSPFPHPSLTPCPVHLLLADTSIYETPNSSPMIYCRKGDVSAHSTLLQSLLAARRGFFCGGQRPASHCLAVRCCAALRGAPLRAHCKPSLPGELHPTSQHHFGHAHITALLFLLLRCSYPFKGSTSATRVLRKYPSPACQSCLAGFLLGWDPKPPHLHLLNK